MKKKPQKVYNELTDFLGIKRFKPEFKILNISRRQPKSEFHAKSFYFIQNLPLPLKKLIKLFSSHRLRGKIKKLHLKEMAQKDKINPGLKHKINTSMEKDIKKLEKIIKKDLSQWLK